MEMDLDKMGSLNDWDNLDEILDKVNFEDFSERINKELKKMHPLNIINIGKAGVGKSTIINAVFGKELAKTGKGETITKHCEAYSIPDSPIKIYDSKGLETGGETNTAILDELYNKIKQQNSTANTKEYIHICWYCVLDDGNRLDENEVEIITKIRETIPVIIVLTQSIGGTQTNEFVAKIKSMFNNIAIDIIPVMALPKKEESEFGVTNIKSHGLDKLVEKSSELLPASVSRTFDAYQNVNFEIKKRSAFTACTLYSGAVAAAAFQPFPIADAPIMVGIQVGMMANITACFGIKPSNLNFKAILSGLGGPFAAAVVGRTLVSLIKLIPGIGTLVGGTINATTGATITFAIGSIYINVLSSVVKNNREINEAEIMEELKRAAENVNMDEMEKAWEKNKNSYSESEAKLIFEEAKKEIKK